MKILVGDVREKLREIEPESVHCVVTSPPYWGLRDYGTAPLVWGGDTACEHDWNKRRYYVEGGGGAGSSAEAFSTPGEANAARIKKARWREDDTCRKCGAWRGQLGLEPTIEEYVSNMVDVFREVRRVLRTDGTLWLNMGDCYAASKGNMGDRGSNNKGNRASSIDGIPHRKNSFRRDRRPREDDPKKWTPGLKPKDLVGQPWRLAFALQADGWYLRSDVIWHKPNPMPESVTDRPTKSHEYVFLLTKAPKYFFDQEAVREGLAGPVHTPGNRDPGKIQGTKAHQGGNSQFRDSNEREWGSATGRNIRSVWSIPTQAYPEAHFATFPERLVEPCIKAGTSEKGCCPECGAPWVRVVKKSGGTTGKAWHDHSDDAHGGQSQEKDFPSKSDYKRETTGWRPTCKCNPPKRAREPVACAILDPFMGSGTTGLVALNSAGGSSASSSIRSTPRWRGGG